VENDITEVGYEYQMTDIGAAIGLAGLEEFPATLKHRQDLFRRYVAGLQGNPNVRIAMDNDSRKVHAAWLFTIFVERRLDLQKKLRDAGIESGQTHYRNDRYSVFNENWALPPHGQRRRPLPGAAAAHQGQPGRCGPHLRPHQLRLVSGWRVCAS